MPQRSRKTKRWKSREADKAFDFLISLTNQKNLEHLLGLCAGVSAIAGHSDPLTDPLARSCHYQVSRILLDAILRSNASPGQKQFLRTEDIHKLINNSRDVTFDPEPLQRLSNVNGTKLARLEFMRFLAALGQVQISAFEEHPHAHAGRALGLLETIPSTQRSEIEKRIATTTQVLDMTPKALLGLSIREAAAVYFLLLRLYADRWQRFDTCLGSAEERLSRHEVELDHFAAHRRWVFTPESLSVQGGETGQVIDAFLRLFSRTPSELRPLIERDESPFNIGHPSCRLLPVDRYPIIALPEENYIIPNITIFRKSFYNVLDFSLLDAYKSCALAGQYNQVRGATLEIYLEELVSKLLPECILIPETEYDTSLGAKRSPDLCILDLEDKSIVAIEAKARRLSPAAAAKATDTAIDNNYTPSLKAIRDLPGKITDLYTKPEFEPWAGDLGRIPKDRAILVSVVPATFFGHDDLEPLRAKLDSQHPLSELDHPFCFLDLFVFEKSVELAQEHKIPLAQLLCEHYEDARTGDRAARLFRGRSRPQSNGSFAAGFISAQPSIS